LVFVPLFCLFSCFFHPHSHFFFFFFICLCLLFFLLSSPLSFFQ
jgi:hypothetical protein